MKKLLLCNTPRLESPSIVKLCRRSPELRELYLKHCPAIHYDVVLEALDLCPQLTHFEYNANPMGTPQETNPAAAAAVSLLSTVIHRDFEKLKYFSVRF